MASPGAPPKIDILSGLSAFQTAYSDYIQQKFDAKGKQSTAAQSNAKSNAPYANFVDDFMLAVVEAIESGAIVGGVSGPLSSTDNALTRWDGVGGATLQDSLVVLDDSGNASGFQSIKVGNGTIATHIELDSIASQAAQLRLTAAGDLRWTISKEATSGHLYFNRYTGSPASFQDAPLKLFNTGSAEFANSLTISGVSTVLGNANPQLTIGEDTGQPTLHYRKGTAFEFATNYYSNAIRRWKYNFEAAGSLKWSLYDGAGVFVVDAFQLLQTTGEAYFGANVTLNSANPIFTVGNGTGQPQLRVKGSNQSIRWVSAADVFQADWALISGELLLRYSVAATTALALDTTTGDITIANDVTLNSGSPTFTLGDGLGSPRLWIDKSDVGNSLLGFKNAGVQRWHLLFGSSEGLSFDRYDAAGVYQDSPIILSWASGTITLAKAVLAASDVTLNSGSPILTIGDGLGSPLVIQNKLGTGSGEYIWQVAGVYQWNLRHDSNEDLALRRYVGGVYQDDAIKITNATGDISLAADLLLNSNSPILTIGGGGGGSGAGGVLVIQGGGTGSSPKLRFKEISDGWNIRHVGSDNTLRFAATDGGTDLVQFADGGNVSLSSTNAVLTIGNGAGQPALTLDGANASQSQLWWEAGGNARWIAARAQTSDDWLLNRYTGASVFQDTPITVSNATGAVTLSTGGGTTLIADSSNRLQSTTHAPLTDGGHALGRTAAAGWSGLALKELADHAQTPTATRGEVWLKNDAPNTLYFTDDAGKDHPLSLMPTISLAANEFTPKATGGSTATTTGGEHAIQRFPNGVTRVAYSKVVTLPREYSGNGLTVRLIWTGNAGAAGNVSWSFAFERLAAGGNVGSTSFGTFKTQHEAGPTVIDDVVIDDFAFTNAEIDSLLAGEAFRLYVDRLGGGGSDTFAGDADLIEVQILENP